MFTQPPNYRIAQADNHRPDRFCVIVERGAGGEKRIPPPRHIPELGTFVSALLFS